MRPLCVTCGREIRGHRICTGPMERRQHRHWKCYDKDGKTMDGDRLYGWWFAEDDDDLVFCKGKHEGEYLSDVAGEDPSYLEWMLDKVDLSEAAESAVKEALT